MPGADRAEKTMVIQNELGLHARAATKLVQTASKYPCDVTVIKDGHEVNGKSIMGVLMLAAEHGSRLRLSASGADAADAVAALSDLVGRGFEDVEA
jgi:phosphocarrier protein